jgi:hypothetical protein
MPDIQTAMQEALKKTADAWAADDDSDNVAPPTATTTLVDVPTDEKSGSTLKTFECIKSNPGKTRQAIFEMLIAAGIKRGSASSLLSQMIDRGNVRDVEGLLYAAQDVYVTLPRRKKPVVVASPPPAVVAPPPPAVAAPAPAEWSASEVVDKLSVRQAREVLNELKVLFGEAV